MPLSICSERCLSPHTLPRQEKAFRSGLGVSFRRFPPVQRSSPCQARRRRWRCRQVFFSVVSRRREVMQNKGVRVSDRRFSQTVRWSARPEETGVARKRAPPAHCSWRWFMRPSRWKWLCQRLMWRLPGRVLGRSLAWDWIAYAKKENILCLIAPHFRIRPEYPLLNTLCWFCVTWFYCCNRRRTLLAS